MVAEGYGVQRAKAERKLAFAQVIDPYWNKLFGAGSGFRFSEDPARLN